MRTEFTPELVLACGYASLRLMRSSCTHEIQWFLCNARPRRGKETSRSAIYLHTLDVIIHNGAHWGPEACTSGCPQKCCCSLCCVPQRYGLPSAAPGEVIPEQFTPASVCIWPLMHVPVNTLVVQWAGNLVWRVFHLFVTALGVGISGHRSHPSLSKDFFNSLYPATCMYQNSF